MSGSVTLIRVSSPAGSGWYFSRARARDSTVSSSVLHRSAASSAAPTSASSG